MNIKEKVKKVCFALLSVVLLSSLVPSSLYGASSTAPIYFGSKFESGSAVINDECNLHTYNMSSSTESLTGKAMRYSFPYPVAWKTVLAPPGQSRTEYIYTGSIATWPTSSSVNGGCFGYTAIQGQSTNQLP